MAVSCMCGQQSSGIIEWNLLEPLVALIADAVH